MNSLRKLAEDYYNFILKYDECFYNKYQKEETEKNEDLLKFNTLFNEVLEEHTRPYKMLPKGKEIEKLEYIFSNDSETLQHYLKIFDYLSDECYDLAEMELKEYYAKNNIKKSHNEISDILIKDMENNIFDSKIFSQELIEKINLMKKSDEIYERLTKVYKNMRVFNSKEMAE